MTNPFFMDVSSLSLLEMKGIVDGSEDRKTRMKPLKEVSVDEVMAQAPLSVCEHIACILLLSYGPPNGAFTVPLTLSIVGYFVFGNIAKTFLWFFLLIFLPLAIIPQPYIKSTTESWISWVVIKYFSAKFISEVELSSQDRHIFVAPPHGVFPYGNVLAVLCFPTYFGFSFRGLASSMALRPPIFKQILRSIGIVDASRHIARKAIEEDGSIGISTGGVAEVFETNADDECVLLKERIGMIKLAIRTGSILVPCYLFGNTKLLNCWAGDGLPLNGKSYLETISRKIGFALILIYGRFGLPIPFRKPVVGVIGKGIQTRHLKCEDPTMEQVQEIQGLLLKEMQRIFDEYKHLYGWEDKKLIIK
mmetsp:Transcript_21157/g.31374  ORF Transcript_21157/g.31374 Transcript_21157/m.31374 type:complete len:362 (-) Transcript_21157:1562-2647(-)